MKVRYVICRCLLVLIVASIVGFLVFHYNGKEYSVQNEEDYVEQLCKMNDVPAVSIAVLDDEKEYFVNYSSSDEREINSNSLFELGSTTKAFTALGIMQLEAQGKFHQLRRLINICHGLNRLMMVK